MSAKENKAYAYDPLRHVYPFGRPTPVFPPEAWAERVDAVVEALDAEGIALCMAALKWSWANVGIPNAEQIRATARRLLYKTLSQLEEGSKLPGVSTGGLRASMNERGELRVDFVLCSSFDQIEFGEESEPLAAGYLCVRTPRAKV